MSNPFTTYLTAYQRYVEFQLLAQELFWVLVGIGQPEHVAAMLCQHTIQLKPEVWEEIMPTDFPLRETVLYYRDEMQLSFTEANQLIRTGNDRLAKAMQRPAPRPDLRYEAPRPYYV